MDNQLKVYQSPTFGNIKVLMIDGKEHFPATECAKQLGYKDTVNAIKRHCRWVAKRHLPHPQSPTKTIQMNFIPEGDLHRLITHSQMPKAKEYESWVFDEVLPSIRKTGTYSNPSSAPAKHIEPPYKYIPKFWQGQQVVTLKDIEVMAGIKESALTMSICHHREDIKPGEMWLLKGNDLRAFRAAHGMRRWSGSLWVLSQQGVYRLASWMRNTPIKLPVWEKEEPMMLPVWKKEEPKQHPIEAAFQAAKPSLCRMDVPGNQMAQEGIARLRKAMTALDAAIDIYNRYSSQQQHENNLIALRVMGDYVSDLTLWLASTPDIKLVYKP